MAKPPCRHLYLTKILPSSANTEEDNDHFRAYCALCHHEFKVVPYVITVEKETT